MESGMKAKWAMAGLIVTLLGAAACTDSDERPSTRASAVDARSVKVGAQQAIAAATAAVPGTAQEVRLESRAGKPEYEVMVLPKEGSSRVRVEVDAASGQVVKSGRGTERDDDDDND